MPEEWFEKFSGQRTPTRLGRFIIERRKRVPTLTEEQVKNVLGLVSNENGFAWNEALSENEENFIRALEKHGYIDFDRDLALSTPTPRGLKAIRAYLASLEKQA